MAQRFSIDPELDFLLDDWEIVFEPDEDNPDTDIEFILEL